MNKNIYSDKCTCTIGCRFHRNWDKNFVRNINYQPNSFSNIDTTNSDKLYGSDKYINSRAKQYLCFIANHEIINYIMKQKAFSVNKIEELNEQEYRVDGKYCYGLNLGMGSKKIAVRLRNNNNIFLSYNIIIDTIIHELTHMDIPDHGEEFYKRQNELRNIYNSFEKISWMNQNNLIEQIISLILLPLYILFKLIIYIYYKIMKLFK